MSLGTIAIIGYLSIPRLVGGIFEAVNGLIVLGLWCAGIAVTQRPNNTLAVATFPGIKTELIRNPNLYFFSWGSFIATVFIMASLLQEWRVVDVQAVPKKLMKWYLLLVSSIVVLGSGSNQKNNTCSSACLDGSLSCFDTKLCKRTDFAVAVGVVGAGLSLIPIIWSLFGDVHGIVEVTIATFSLALYCVGVGKVQIIFSHHDSYDNPTFSHIIVVTKLLSLAQQDLAAPLGTSISSCGLVLEFLPS